MTQPNYTIEVIESAPFGQNAFVLWHEGRTDAIVFDPGFDSRSILQLLEARKLRLAAILDTHGHVDHIAGNAAPSRPIRTPRWSSAVTRSPRSATPISI